MSESILGLTDNEAAQRRARGQGNDVHLATSRSYLRIVRDNAFTFINTILFGIGVALILMGKAGDALVTAGLVLLNVIASVYQEGRAKKKLDQIALLTRPKVTVIRDGQERVVDPAEVVLGDILLARPGDQIVVDGVVVGGREMEADESLLTGESDRVTKRDGDHVLSGSFSVSGSAYYRAEKVGRESYANQLTAGARVFRQVRTPLQQDINYVIRVLVLLVAQLGLLIAISFIVRGLPLVEGVRVAAVIVALVPQGLFFMATVAYAMGAYRVAGRGALIQQVNAVESASNVNVLCLDKTGTLTTNRILLQEIVPWGQHPLAMDDLQTRLGAYAASTPEANRTLEALGAACPGEAVPVEERVPFSSELKWSALTLTLDDRPETYVLGAPEMLQPAVDWAQELERAVAERALRGLRVLLFAVRRETLALHDDADDPRLPDHLQVLGLLSFSDELRPDARETLERFARLGIRIELISGDNPDTVLALARQAGLGDDLRAISGLDLAQMDDAALEVAVDEYGIFGRITPQQKEKLVGLLRRKGCYVAMIGDGVNDVLSLKQAHVGIAMESGSPATRSVADIILLGDSFSVLPLAFREGQRIIRGMEDVVRLLLTRTLYVLLLVIATRIVGMDFPISPKHNSLLALLTVGIPILAIAAWARPGQPARSILKVAGHFVLPAAATLSLLGLGVYLYYGEVLGNVPLGQSALTTVSILAGLVLIPFVEPPARGWVGGDEFSGDWRPTYLALGMLALYVLILLWPPLRGFFKLELLPPLHYAVLAGLVALWALVLRIIWRLNLFERLLLPRRGMSATGHSEKGHAL